MATLGTNPNLKVGLASKYSLSKKAAKKVKSIVKKKASKTKGKY
jgi:hypothetical protein